MKLLFGGNISTTDGWDTLIARLTKLQASSHGPFELLIICGELFSDESQYQYALQSEHELPLACYLTRKPAFMTECKLKDMYFINDGLESPGNDVIGITTIRNLTIVYYDDSKNCNDVSEEKLSSGISSLCDICESDAYRGCDLFISNHWPRDTHYFLEVKDHNALQELGLGLGSGDELTSKLAAITRPRYHFTALPTSELYAMVNDSDKKEGSNPKYARNVFYQRPPYRNCIGNSTTVSQSIATRFLSIASVPNSNVTGKQPTTAKWMHALNIDPIIHMTSNELYNLSGQGITDCPYTDIVNDTNKTHKASSNTRNSLLSMSKRSFHRVDLNGNKNPHNYGATVINVTKLDSEVNKGSFMFGEGIKMKKKREMNLIPPSDTAVKLFIGGLIATIDGEYMKKLLPGARRVMRPVGKSFAFVEFDCHANAARVVEASVKNPKGVILGGKTVSIGWAEEREKEKKGEEEVVPSITLTIPEGMSLPPDAVGNFIVKVRSASLEEEKKNEDGSSDKPVVSIRSYEKMSSSSQGPSIRYISTNRSTQSLLNSNITVAPSADSDTLFLGNIPSHRPVATQEIVEIFEGVASRLSINNDAISVFKPEGRTFAFVTFGSHEQAQSIMTSRRVGNRNEGNKGEGNEKEDAQVCLYVADKVLELDSTPLTLGWAKGRARDALPVPDQAPMTMKISQNDHAMGCWFCLSNPECKTHLLTSIGQHIYMALPRGSMHSHHVMLCPIECVPNRLHLSMDAQKEFNQYESAMHSFYNSLGLAYVKYERAMRTKGKDHLQVHYIPFAVDGGNGDNHSNEKGRRVKNALSVFKRIVNGHISDTRNRRRMQQQKENSVDEEEYQNKLIFHELPSDELRSIEEVVLSMPGGPYQEFFEVTLPVTGDTTESSEVEGPPKKRGKADEADMDTEKPLEWGYQRFLYLHEGRQESVNPVVPPPPPLEGDNGSNKPPPPSSQPQQDTFRFPMLLGAEIAAHIMEEPSKQHWKNCVLSERDETVLAEKFKQAFQSFDFTLQS